MRDLWPQDNKCLDGHFLSVNICGIYVLSVNIREISEPFFRGRDEIDKSLQR